MKLIQFQSLSVFFAKLASFAKIPKSEQKEMVAQQNAESAGLTLEGAVVERDADSTRAIYGSDVPFKTILLGDVAAPAQADPFLRAVEDIGHQARAQEATEQAPADQKKEDQK